MIFSPMILLREHRKRCHSFSALFLGYALLYGLLVIGLSGCIGEKLGEEDLFPSLPSQRGGQQTDQKTQEAIPSVVSSSASVASQEHLMILRAYGGVYEAPALQRFLDKLLERLAVASGNPPHSYRTTLLNTPALNAFALSGGRVYVTRGLLALANDTSELAAVLAHEIAHLTAGHAAERQKQRAVAAALLQAHPTSSSETSLPLPSPTSSPRASLARFSQKQELEADIIGVQTLAKAGFDPYAAARFLHAMERYTALLLGETSDPSKGAFLSSHPSTPERIAVAETMARKLSSAGLEVQRIGRQKKDPYLSYINGLVFGEDPATGALSGTSFVNLTEGIVLHFPKNALLEQNREGISGLLTHTEGGSPSVLLRFDRISLSDKMAPPTYLQSGWIRGLKKESIHASLLNGFPAATALAQTSGWFFHIGIVRVGSSGYRLIFATETPEERHSEKLFLETFRSFRRLARKEKEMIHPLFLQIVRARPGDTLTTLSQKMTGVSPEVRSLLLKALNQIEEGEAIEVNRLYKVVGGIPFSSLWARSGF